MVIFFVFFSKRHFKTPDPIAQGKGNLRFSQAEVFYLFFCFVDASTHRGDRIVACQSWQRPPGQRSLKRHRTCELRPLDGRRAGLLRVLLGTEFDTSRQTNGAGRRYILPSSVAEYWRRARIFESYRFFFYRCRILLFSHLQNVYTCMFVLV